MKKIYTAGDLQEAWLIRNLLESERIETAVFNQFAMGAAGELPFGHTYPEVWADARHARRATTLIEAFLNRPAAAGERRCGQCEETSPESFETCWRCQADLTQD